MYYLIKFVTCTGVEFRFNHSNLTVLESSGVAMVCVELVSVFGGLERDVEISVTVQAATAGRNSHELRVTIP